MKPPIVDLVPEDKKQVNWSLQINGIHIWRFRTDDPGMFDPVDFRKRIREALEKKNETTQSKSQLDGQVR